MRALQWSRNDHPYKLPRKRRIGRIFNCDQFTDPVYHPAMVWDWVQGMGGSWALSKQELALRSYLGNPVQAPPWCKVLQKPTQHEAS